MKTFIKVKANVKVTLPAKSAGAKKADSPAREKNRKISFYVHPDSIAALIKSDKNSHKVIFKDKIEQAIELSIGNKFTDPVVNSGDLK